MLKTFVISKAQVTALRELLILNGEIHEARKFKGSELAFRWKCINMTGFPPTKREQFIKQYPYMVDFDIHSIGKKKIEDVQEMSSPVATEAQMTVEEVNA